VGFFVERAVNYYEHHLGDWAAATGHLTWDEDMAYTRLLRAYYKAESAIQDGQQYRLARATTPAQRKAVDAVLSEFFALVDGHHHQSRADAEIERFQDKQRKAKASANARWAHTERNANASPDAMRTHSEGNAPRAHSIPQTPDTKEKENAPPSSVAPSKPSASGTRIPADWDPGTSGNAFAEQQGLLNGRASVELAKFRDYWTAQPGQKGRKADWQATWRNWVRRVAETAPKGGRPPDDLADLFRRGASGGST
jgi:uncharacterized protein YdaU (DUF1376 family)